MLTIRSVEMHVMYSQSFFVMLCRINLSLSLSDQEVLLSWDGEIRNVCHVVNSIVDKISAQHSDWVATARAAVIKLMSTM